MRRWGNTLATWCAGGCKGFAAAAGTAAAGAARLLLVLPPALPPLPLLVPLLPPPCTSSSACRCFALLLPPRRSTWWLPWCWACATSCELFMQQPGEGRHGCVSPAGAGFLQCSMPTLAPAAPPAAPCSAQTAACPRLPLPAAPPSSFLRCRAATSICSRRAPARQSAFLLPATAAAAAARARLCLRCCCTRGGRWRARNATQPLTQCCCSVH